MVSVRVFRTEVAGGRLGAEVVQMRVLPAPRVAGSAAAVSAGLVVGQLALSYVDRHLLHGFYPAWSFSDVLGSLTYLAIPVVGFVLASRRPENRIGWLLVV